MAWHDRRLPALLILVAGVVWLGVGYVQQTEAIRSATMFSTENGIVDTNAMQKLLLCGVLMSLMRRLDKVLGRKLDYLANASFGIYLLHMFFIQAYRRFVTGYTPQAASLWLYLLVVSTVVVLCVCCLWMSRLVLGRYSRNVVGF